MSPRRKSSVDPKEIDLQMEIPSDPRYNQFMHLINYDNSILSVSNSILKHYGCEVKHKTNPMLDEKLSRDPKNVVLILLDGMGVHSLKELLGENAFLRKNMADEISSVFPPTTVAATSSILSGLSPIEHARLGWQLYYKEVEDNVTVFTNVCQATEKVLQGENLADKYMPYKDIFSQIEENSDAKAYMISSFSSFKCRSSAEVFANAKRICGNDDKNFIYCYWMNPDTDMHEYGTRSWRAKKDLFILNAQIRKLCAELENTTVIVIADHGLVDIEWENIAEHGKLSAMLKHKPTIERRAASLFVMDGLKAEFAREFRNVFGEKFLLLTKEEVLKNKMFGDGEQHEMIDEFLGDFLAVSTDKWSLDGRKGDSDMHASHAGLTEEEMMVPLIIIEK